MSVYYNENDPFATAWLCELMKAGQIPEEVVDERSIVDVQPDDVRGFTQCHFFAGIGGWAYALRLAEWGDRPVWTGSCPCQGISSAARGRYASPDLWPEFRRLIAQVSPRTVVGEQVLQSDWVDAFCVDMEALGYDVGATILPAVVVGQDHARPRFYFACDAHSYGQSSVSVDAKMAGVSGHRSHAKRMVSQNGVSRDVVAFSGFGNAIIPQVAEAFLRSYLEVTR